MSFPPTIKLVMADVDIFCKLAAWDLLDCVPELFQCSWQEVATLSSLRFRILREISTDKFRLLRSKVAAEKALIIVESMQELPSSPAEALAAFQSLATVDPGEAILFAIASQHPNAYLLTGDKRAVIGVAIAAKHNKALRLHRQIVCLEQMLAAILQAKGIEWMRSKICPNKDIDKVVSAVMGSRCDAPLSAVAEGLQSYIQDLAGQCEAFLSETPTLAAA